MCLGGAQLNRYRVAVSVGMVRRRDRYDDDRTAIWLRFAAEVSGLACRDALDFGPLETGEKMMTTGEQQVSLGLRSH